MLYRGMVGQDILRLQKNLGISLGVKLLEDGLFGPQTRAAVKAFQQLSGLPITGVVDKVTLGVLLDTVSKASTDAEKSFANSST